MEFWETFGVLLDLVSLENLEIAEDFFDLEDLSGLITLEDLEELKAYARASSLAVWIAGIPDGLKGRSALVCIATQAQYIHAVGGDWSLRKLAALYADHIGSTPAAVLQAMRYACKKGHGCTPGLVVQVAVDLWRAIHEN